MKKILIVISLMVLNSSIAQKKDETKPVVNRKVRVEEVPKGTESASDTGMYKHWSFDLEVGTNKPMSPYLPGYYSSNTQNNFPINNINHYGGGIRYMFSNVFGLRLEGAYERITNNENSASLPFNTTQTRGGIQGIINLGRICRFETFTSRFNILGHSGFQISQLKVNEGENETLTEMNGGFVVGLTPQIRIIDQLSLTFDFTAMINFRQHLNWDGSMSVDNNLGGTLYNASVGLSFNFANSTKKHADWYVPATRSNGPDDSTKKRLNHIESLLNDSDKDGVPDYLDAENNTPKGVAVDRKGRNMDVNRSAVALDEPKPVDGKNGTDAQANPYAAPDAAAGNNIYNTNNSFTGGLSNADAVSDLIKNGYLNIFFDVDIDTPNVGSTDNVYYVVMFLKKHPDAKIKLQGFTDSRGGDKYNQDLSDRRVANLKKLFAACGIKGERVGIQGLGIDKSLPTDSKTGLDIARRVSVTLE